MIRLMEPTDPKNLRMRSYPGFLLMLYQTMVVTEDGKKWEVTVAIK